MINFNENPNTLNYDLRYQRLELDLDPAQLYVSGTVTNHFIPNQDISSIYFDLSNQLTVSQVLYHGNPIGFSQLSTKEIKIDFPAQIPASTLDSLSIKYAGVPDSTGSAGSAFTVSTQGGVPALYTLSEPYGAQEWFPTKQSMNDKIEKVDFKITTPSQYNVAANGKLLSETPLAGGKKLTFWQTNYPIPAYLIGLGVTNYTKFNDTMGNPPFPFVNYVYPSTASNPTLMSNINWTKDIMNVFEEYYGPYPYRNEKYGHMEFGWNGGMEHATMTSMGSWGRGTIAHELTHQWFGDKVTCGAWNDIWLNEGFARFGEHLANEKLLLNNSDFMSYLASEINYITGSPGGSVYVADSDLSNVSTVFNGRLSYSKGAFVLRMLKWILGDDAFYAALRDYNNRPNLAYNYAKTGDFAASLQQSTGKDFTEFFNEWIYGQGYPTYTIKWNQVNGNIIFKVSQTQSQPSVSFFKMPLPIKLTDDTGNATYFVLDNNTNDQIFVFSLASTTASVQFNYEYQMLERDSTVTKDTTLLGVQDVNTEKITLYPNPVKDILNIQSSVFKVQNAKIYDISGKLVKTFNGNSVNISALQKGIYILKVDNQTFKFVKG
jgi:aminopeptidase N